VSSSGVIRTLQDRGLIDIVGRAEGIGRPLLYGTTSRFLEHFGFRSLDALPTPEELPIVLRERTPLGPEGEDVPTEAELERAGQVALTLDARAQAAAEGLEAGEGGAPAGASGAAPAEADPGVPGAETSGEPESSDPALSDLAAGDAETDRSAGEPGHG
jgi:segregation and condensation protein B